MVIIGSMSVSINRGMMWMNVDIVSELINDNKTAGLTLLFVTNEEEQVDEIDKQKSKDNILYVTVPKKSSD
jgi:hypothetical protein